MPEPPLRVERAANLFGRAALAVLVDAEADDVRRAQDGARRLAVFERNHLLAPVALDARGQPAGPPGVGDERRVLLSREPRLGLEVVLKGVERDAFEAALDLVAQGAVERRVEREEELELRVGAQARRLVRVRAAAAGDEIEDGAAEEVVKVSVA